MIYFRGTNRGMTWGKKVKAKDIFNQTDLAITVENLSLGKAGSRRLTEAVTLAYVEHLVPGSLALLSLVLRPLSLLLLVPGPQSVLNLVLRPLSLLSLLSTNHWHYYFYYLDCYYCDWQLPMDQTHLNSVCSPGEIWLRWLSSTEWGVEWDNGLDWPWWGGNTTWMRDTTLIDGRVLCSRGYCIIHR